MAFPIKLLGPIRKFAGIDVHHPGHHGPGSITLSSESFITSMVPKFVSMEKLNKASGSALPAYVHDKAERTDSYSKITNSDGSPKLALHAFAEQSLG